MRTGEGGHWSNRSSFSGDPRAGRCVLLLAVVLQDTTYPCLLEYKHHKFFCMIPAYPPLPLSHPVKNLTTAEISKEPSPIRTYCTWSSLLLGFVLTGRVMTLHDLTISFMISSLLFLLGQGVRAMQAVVLFLLQDGRLLHVVWLVQNILRKALSAISCEANCMKASSVRLSWKSTGNPMSQKSISFHAIFSKDFLRKSVVMDVVLIEHQKSSMPAYYRQRAPLEISTNSRSLMPNAASAAGLLGRWDHQLIPSCSGAQACGKAGASDFSMRVLWAGR
ncbi:hypothetical protein QTO34_001345 [Cnephaeus nilssonii]|uniref:Uncharacterized protein n=1 Tax=Cnephaeus nilssonii TaxID=3371016 RepID=A0AA40HVI3_CNENI|nr:hypothetical protein QTO34_001345 [Eptesicus nilssonii]